MCDIAGLIDPAGLDAEWRSDLDALGASLHHRGPEGWGQIPPRIAGRGTTLRREVQAGAATTTTGALNPSPLALAGPAGQSHRPRHR